MIPIRSARDRPYLGLPATRAAGAKPRQESAAGELLRFLAQKVRRRVEAGGSDLVVDDVDADIMPAGRDAELVGEAGLDQRRNGRGGFGPVESPILHHGPDE